MPQSIPKGLNRQSVLQALADLDAGINHPFGAPTAYKLVYEGRRYLPKAVIGLASRSLIGRVPLPEEFSGGEAPGQANFVLRELGFTVETKGPKEPKSGGEDWSHDEVELIVADYFMMLGAELAGSAYSKADHNRKLRTMLVGRSKSSVEFKHQNISAVLMEMGLPYIDGYKPARNFQNAILPQAVEDFLIRNSDYLDTIANRAILNPVAAPTVEERPIEGNFEGRPERIIVPSQHTKPWLSRHVKPIDFARRDAANRLLGELGEKFAIEKRRLLFYGRDDLAAKVEWVAMTCGDGVGFDVLSFDENDAAEHFTEVKTTGLGKHFPFYVTANEVRCSEDCPDQFRLYRVFDFARKPRVYVVSGALSRECRLEPIAYRVAL